MRGSPLSSRIRRDRLLDFTRPIGVLGRPLPEPVCSRGTRTNAAPDQPPLLDASLGDWDSFDGVKRFSDLLRVYTEIQGIPFRELAETLTYDISKDPKSMKAAAGDIAEIVAGKKPDSLPEADFSQFDIEVKTVPLDLMGHPRENTKITALNYTRLLTEEWATSHVYEKVRVVLFVPIVKEDTKRPDSWYVRSPFIWMPSRGQLSVIRNDWETIQGMVQRGEQLAAKIGQYLIANTSGQGKGRDERTYHLLNGRAIKVKTRAFFLRKTFVSEILEANIQFRA